MLTISTRKPSNTETPSRPERGRGRLPAPASVPSIGPFLRERREAMGVTLAEAEVATRIRQKYLAALEADEWELLPGEVVGRGFLRNYATYLGLEPNEMIERRRAVADDSLAAVLLNTSAGTALPPERKVDYRPKDVALKDETQELEEPRQLNLTPLLSILTIVGVVVFVWWGVTQFGAQLGGLFTAAQQQITAWQQATPAATSQATPASTVELPPNLQARAVTTAVALPAAAATSALPTADAAAATPVPAADQLPTPAVTSAVSLLGLLPTPTPTPEITPTPAPVAVQTTVLTAANLRTGPGTDYTVVGAATEGQALVIVGRNGESTWYLLDSGAWIFGELIANPPVDAPVAETPPLPAEGQP